MNNGINNGATCRPNLDALPKAQDETDAHDVTLVICMLINVSGDAIAKFSETITAGNDLRDLCVHLMRFKRQCL